MITGLYETHLEVSNLERSIEFYQRLGLQLALIDQRRSIAFFWVGQPGEFMLGLWQTSEGVELGPNRPMATRHFAFRVSADDIKNAKTWLAERGIECQNGQGKPTEEPIVHRWMAAAVVYFPDPDGNLLELVGVLDEVPDVPQEDTIPPGAAFTPTLSDWLKERSNIK